VARRRTAAEQVGVPELDEQEERERQEAAAAREEEAEQARLAAEAEAGDAGGDDPLAWLPEKFKKDPAKLLESYTALERELQTRAERERTQAARIAELEEYARAPEDDGELIYGVSRDRVEAALEENPLETHKWLAEQAAAVALQGAARSSAQASRPGEALQNSMFARAINEEMAAEYEDWEELADQVRDRLAEDPTLMPESVFAGADPLGAAKRHLSMIYRDIKYDSLVEHDQELRARGLQQKDLDSARKREAQTLSGASGRAPEPSEAEKELAEMRAALSGSSYGLHRAQEKRG